jgi:hypothetical protein
MIMRILSFTMGIFSEIGPGLILTALLPVTLIAFAVVMGEVVRRVRQRGTRVAAG